jgi:hypothetical protein
LFRKTLALALFIVGISAFPYFTAAFSGASVIVDPIEGKAGETVEVAVRMEGVAEIPGVEGFAGGELKILYDPDLAEVKGVAEGELLSSGALFVYNEAYAEDTVMATWVSTGEALSRDGVLFYVTFLLKEGGEAAAVIKDLEVCDQHLRPLVVVSGSGAGEKGAESAVAIYAADAVAGVDYPDPVTADEVPAIGVKPGTGGKELSVWHYVSIIVLVIAALAAVLYIFRRRCSSSISR